MIGRLQRIFTFAMLLVSLLWAAFFWYRGDQLPGLVAPVLFFLGYAIFLGAEFLLLALLGGEDAELPRAHLPELIRAWLGEVWRTPVVFCWWQPFRSHREPDVLTSDASG